MGMPLIRDGEILFHLLKYVRLGSNLMECWFLML